MRFDLKLVFRVYIAHAFLTQIVSCEEYWCSESSREAICYCETTGKTPWSSDTDKPAPRPYNMSLQWYTFQHDRRSYIGVHISWTQKVSDFDSGYIQGFYIQATSNRVVDPTEYNCTVTRMNTTDTLVTFHFNDTRQPPGQIIYEGQEWNYDLMPIPLYGWNMTTSTLTKTIEIPECRNDDEICQTESCEYDDCRKDEVPPNGPREDGDQTTVAVLPTSTGRNTTRPDESDSTTSEYTVSDSSTLKILIPSSAVICVIIVLIVIILRVWLRGRRKKFLPSEKQSRHVLIIGECNNAPALKITNEFVEMLQKCGGKNIKITTNARQVVEVAKQGIIKWTSQRLPEADVVVFLATGRLPETQNCEEDHPLLGDLSQVSAAINAVEAALLANPNKEKEYFLVHNEKMAAREISSHLCRAFLFPSELQQLTEAILGPCYSSCAFHKHKELFEKTLSDVEKFFLPDPPQVAAASLLGNDLNEHHHDGVRISLTTFNIVQNEYPSLESNACNVP